MSNQTENTFNENQSKHTILDAMPAMEGQLGDRQALTIFAARLRGELILPGDSDYEAARVNPTCRQIRLRTGHASLCA
jgi:hypothetical protein